MANTLPKDIKETFIDFGMIGALDVKNRRLMSQLRNLGIHCRDYHLEALLRHPRMTESLGRQLTKAIVSVIEHKGRKYPRPALRPKKDWSRCAEKC